MVSAPPPVIVMLSRPGCHLCEETRAVMDDLLSERGRAGQHVPEVREVSIESDERLLRRHLETIPVLVIGDEELPLAIDPTAIRAFLARTIATDQPAHAATDVPETATSPAAHLTDA